MIMPVLAIVLDSKATNAASETNTEYFATDDINVRSHNHVCHAIIDYCQRRYQQHKSRFTSQVVKHTLPGEQAVQFGVAVVVEQDILAIHEIAALRQEMAGLAARLEQRSDTTPLNFDGVDDATRDLCARIQDEVIQNLTRVHGGERLSQPLRIVVSDAAIANLKTQILSRPPAPLPESKLDVTGMIEIMNFPKRTCRITTKDGGSITAYISDKPLRQKIADVAAGDQVVRLHLRHLGDRGSPDMYEVKEIHKVEAEACPLTGA
jgi:hypothetical protein